MQCLCRGMALLATLTLLASVSGASCRELYVHPPYFPTSLCPGEPCHTLDWYIQHSDTYITSNTVFKLLPGEHEITNPLTARNVQNVSIEGIEIWNGMRPLILHKEALCHDMQDSSLTVTASNQSWAAVQFINVTNVTVRGVMIVVDGVSTYQSVSALSLKHVDQLQAVDLDISVFPPAVHNALPQTIGIRIENGTRVTLNSTVIYAGEFGVFVDMGSNILLAKLNVSNCSVAISINTAESVICNNIFISQSSSMGLDVVNSNTVLVAQTNIENSTGTGVRVSFCHTFTMMEIFLINTGENAMEISDSSNGKIQHVHISESYDNGVTLRGVNTIYLLSLVITDTKVSGLTLVNADSIWMSDITISNAGRNGLEINGSFDIAIFGSNVSHSQHNGIYITLTDNISITDTIINNSINYWNTGILLNGTEKSMIANITMKNIYNGLDMSCAKYATISNATISNARENGIIGNSTTNVAVYSSVISNTRVGIKMNRSENTTVISVTLFDILSHGVFMNLSTFPVIIDTNISSCFVGVVLLNSSYITISRVIMDIYRVGIRMRNSDRITIRNATITTEWCYYGIVGYGASHVSLLHTSIILGEIRMYNGHHLTVFYLTVSNAGNGIRLYGLDKVILSHSTIDGSWNNGMYLYNTNHTTISHTSVNNSGSNGMYLYKTNDATISHTSVNNTGSNGMYLYNTNDATISHTSVSNAGLNGIELDHSHYITIFYTIIRDTGERGIQQFNSSDVNIMLTTIT